MPAKYFDPQTLARIRPLGLRARYLVEGYVAGMHRSPHQGRSIEFAQHREYAPGDDLRQVDWKVFARTDKYYLKQYEDETNLVCNLLLDTSESMSYRSNPDGLSKLEYAQLTAVSLAHLVLSQQDSVGLSTMNETLTRSLSPSSSPAQIQNIVTLLESAPPSGKTKIELAAKQLAGKGTKRGVTVILSDLLDVPGSVLQGIKHLKHQRHDVLVLQILDKAEIDFPFKRPTRFLGLEGWSPLTVNPAGLRSAYRKELEKHLSLLREGCRAMEVDYHLMTTDQPLHLSLPYLLAHRQQRRL